MKVLRKIYESYFIKKQCKLAGKIKIKCQRENLLEKLETFQFYNSFSLCFLVEQNKTFVAQIRCFYSRKQINLFAYYF